MLLQAGVSFTERDLKKNPPSEAEIRALLNGQPAATLYAARGRQNKVLGIEPARLTDEEMITWMARESALIRRPTLVVDGRLIPQPSRAELERLAQGEAAPPG